MLYWQYLGLVVVFVLFMGTAEAHAANPNLFVSAENSKFDNHFSGSMVVEVVITDPSLRDTGAAEGEPDVTINGKLLRMVQATDGNWYAYFANAKMAQEADSTVGLPSQGLDFGVFCSSVTAESVFGVSFSDTRGFAIARQAPGSADGNATFSECTGPPTGTNLNNVVRRASSINTNSNVSLGQIGLDANTWPLIQLYSFSNVDIQYNPRGSTQKVSLDYDEIPNISMGVDRELFPNNAEVFLTVNDFQLNQDPTDEDSWTFGVGSSPSVFYQAFDESGNSYADGTAGLVNLAPHLSRIGFDDNGLLSVNLGYILEIQSNREQPNTSVSDGTTTYSEILTLVESSRNSGMFDNADNSNQSTLKVLSDAPRGQAGTITYNKNSISVVTGSSSASMVITNPTLTIGDGTDSLRPGTKFSMVLVDPDQNTNSGLRDTLDVFRNSAIIPTMKIGSPLTLESASDVHFYPMSNTPLNRGASADSALSDANSARLGIDTSAVSDGPFEKISLNLGVSAFTMQSLLIDSATGNGTNWLNYDFRSFANELDISDLSDTSIELSFGTLGVSSIKLVDSRDLSSPAGLVQIGDDIVKSISENDGTIYAVINFDATDDTSNVGKISSETTPLPIILDFVSFGIADGKSVNNSIYRFELEETSVNSSTFDGTIEYAVANQLNITDPKFIKTIQTIDDQIKFVITDRLVGDNGITISYSDLNVSGTFTPTAIKSQATTSSGVLSSDSKSYRFGQPVTITLNDPDLNLKNDLVDIYFTVNDPNSANVDTVGRDGVILFEVLIKDIRYKRCMVNGVEYGGLGASGFSLVETGSSTGIFTGVFKMPSKICNKSGTGLISSAGGSLDAKYYDSRDASGSANTYSLLKSTTSNYAITQLDTYEIAKPGPGETEQIILSGNLNNHKRGVPLAVLIIAPDQSIHNFAASVSGNGGYRSAIYLNEDSPSGIYQIELFYDDRITGTVSFLVTDPVIPDWIKNNAKWWSLDTISDSEFLDGIEYMISEGLISILPSSSATSERNIPDWIKNNAKWWADDQISDDEFLKSIQYLVKKGIIQL